GRRSALPIDPRSAFQPYGSAEAPIAIRPVAPPASATRTIAPRLPGSWMSAATRSSGCPANIDAGGSGRSAIATTALDDRTGLIKKFEEEIAALNHELKLELPREIKRARELGDLRENAEYQAAKERQRLVESRISMLQKRVGEIALINVDRIPKDRAGFGSTLHVVEGNGEKMTFQLVMPEDADAERGMISTTSPIGRALINKEPGDSVKVTTPGGMREFEIVKLITIHDEAAG